MKKNADRFVTALYCDDVRHEMGNKLSFMGCYQRELVVPAAPALLGKLCVYASVSTPVARPFKSLSLRVVQDDDKELARLEVPADGLAEAAGIADEGATRKVVSTVLNFAPFFIERPTKLRLLADTEEGEIIGPRLVIRVASAVAAPPHVVEESKAAPYVAAKRKPVGRMKPASTRKS